MNCPKCGGFGYTEHLPTTNEIPSLLLVFHCAICGEILDPTIIEHRALTTSQKINRLSKGARPRFKL